MKVYLDDEREAPPGWLLIRRPEELFELLRADKVSELSLDNDLGVYGENQSIEYEGKHYIHASARRDLEGYEIADWILWYCEINQEFVPPFLYAHTANPPRATHINTVAEQLLPLHTCFICGKDIDALTRIGGTKTLVGPDNKLTRVCKYHKGV